MNLRFRKLTAAATALLLAALSTFSGFTAAAAELPADTGNPTLLSAAEPAAEEPAAAGTTYYISADGDDANDGSIGSPKRDVTKIAGALKPGDTVIFREGTYNGRIVLQQQGDPQKAPITLKAYDGENVTLTSDAGDIIYLGHCRNIRIENLTLSGKNGVHRSNAIDINNWWYSYPQSGDLVITGCKFIDCSPAVTVRDVIENRDTDKKFGRLEFSNNVVMPSDPNNKLQMGLNLQEARVQEGSDGLLYNNLFLNCKWSIRMWGRSENLKIYNNTFLDDYDMKGAAGEYDIYPVQGAYNKKLFQPDISYNCVFKNNIFTKPIRTQLEANATIVDKDKGNIFENNIYDSTFMTDYVCYNYGGQGPKLTFEELQSYQEAGHEAAGRYEEVAFIDREGDAHLDGNDNPARTGAAEEIAAGVSAPEFDQNGVKRNGEMGAFAFDSSRAFVGENTSGIITGSYRNPYTSLKSAFMAGATEIQVKAGTYEENDLQIPAGCTVMPYGEDEVILNGKITLKGGETATSIRNITFTGAVSTGQNAKLENCVLEEAAAINGSASFTGCLFRAGASVKEGSVSFLNNVFTGAAGCALSVDGGSADIRHNTFFGNASDLAVNPGTSAQVHSNIFSAAVTRGSGSFSHNCYHAGTLDSSALEQISEDHAIKEDPEFLNEKDGDFRLWKGSACIGKALADENVPENDRLGTVRPPAPAIGAYEATNETYTYYVDPAGDDAASGTADAPLKTIAAAAAAIRAGEEIIVREGTYTEDVTISDKKALGKDGFTIRAEGSAVLNGTITANGCSPLTISALEISDDAKAFDLTDTDITLENVTLQAPTGISAQGGSITAADTAFSECQTAIESGSTDLDITRTRILGGEKAISLDGGSLKITSSLLNGSAAGIEAANADVIAVNNTFYDMEGLTLDVSGTVKNFISLNNAFARSSRSAQPFIRVPDGNFQSSNNLYDADEEEPVAVIGTENRTLAQMQETSNESNSLLAEPMFRDAASGNFYPEKGSPLARGGRTHASAPKLDLNGTKFADIPDIGAIYSPYTLKTFHIVADGMQGSSSDGSFENPFSTLKEALNVVNSSDTIVIHKGVHAWGRMDLMNIHGVEGAPITICGCKDADCTYCQRYDAKDFPGCPWNAPDLERPILTGSQKYSYDDKSIKSPADMSMKLTNCSHIVIEGLDFAGFSGAAIWIYGGDFITLQDLRIWNIDHQDEITSGVQGILVNNGSNCNISNNRIWDIGYTRRSHADHGIYVGGIKDSVFNNNVIIDSPGGGMQFYSGDNYKIHAENCTIQNNVFYQSRFGLILCGMENSNISNNTFADSLSDDLYLDWTVQNNTFANNIFFNQFTAETHPMKNTTKLIARHDGSGENKVLNNTFTNSIYDYRGSAPEAEESWGDYMSFDAFLKIQKYGNLNTFTEFEPGSVIFNAYLPSEGLDHAARAEQVDTLLFRISEESDAIGKGLAEYAPSLDRDGVDRKDPPDLGAYEGKNIKALTLDRRIVDESSEAGMIVANAFIAGQDASASDVYSLVSGEGDTDNALFRMDGNVLKAINGLDYETQKTYSVRIRCVSEGVTYEERFVITVRDVDENGAADHMIPMIDTPITLDGILNESEWKDSFTGLKVGQDGSSEFKAESALLADETALYLAVRITDSELCNNLNPGVDFNADLLEAYIDGNNMQGSAYDKETVQMQFRWNDDKVYIYGNDKPFAGVRFKMAKTADGYVMEASIPWRDIGIAPSPDHTIGFTLIAQDYDHTTGQTNSLAMIEGSDFWKDRSLWESYGFKPVETAPETGSSSGSKPLTGWVTIGENQYYYTESGQRITEDFVKSGNDWYYFGKNGAMVKNGWIHHTDGFWYYFKADGKMATGWLLDNNVWYFLHADGKMATGWLWNGGHWYYLYRWGGMARSGWVLDNGCWYYLLDNGTMAANRWLLHTDKNWYYTGKEGKMAVSCLTPDGYRVDANGAWVR